MLFWISAVALGQVPLETWLDADEISANEEDYVNQFPDFEPGQSLPPQGIVNGTDADPYELQQVVALVDGFGYVFCSGTLVHESWVVSAAHCMEGGNGPAYIAFGGNVYDPAELTDLIEVQRSIPHPSYPNAYAEYDIGLIELAWPKTDIPVMAVNDESMSNAQIGEEMLFAGFGVTSDNGPGVGTKRYADIPIEYVFDLIVHSYDPSGQNVCSGDSGGAALEITPDGYELAGVNDYVFGYYGTFCINGHNGAARVDRFISWIEGYVPSLVYGASQVEPPDTEPPTGGNNGGGNYTGNNNGGNYTGNNNGGNYTGNNNGGNNNGGGNGTGNNNGADNGGGTQPELKPPDVGQSSPVGPVMADTIRPEGFPCGVRCDVSAGQGSMWFLMMMGLIAARRRR